MAPVAGATVKVWWIPGLQHAQPGDELAIETIGTARAATDGSYTVEVAPTAAMARAAADNGGWLNFDVGASAPSLGALDTTGVSRRLVNGVWTAPQEVTSGLTAVGSAASSATMTVDDELPRTPTSRTAKTDLVLTPTAALSGTARSGKAAFGGTAATTDEAETTAGVAYCSFIVDARPKRTVDVVEFHNASNSNAKWTYGQSADSDIEAGIDYGGDGGWKVGSTRHVSNARSATVYREYNGGDKANNYGTSDFEFIDGHYEPYGNGTTCEGSSIPVNTKVKNPVEWVGGVGSNHTAGSEYVGCDQKPQSDHRTSYPAGSGFTRNDSNASEITAAVDIGPIHVGASSGFSTYLDSHWDSKRGSGIWLCGTNNYPTSAGVIHAQNRP